MLNTGAMIAETKENEKQALGGMPGGGMGGHVLIVRGRPRVLSRSGRRPSELNVEGRRPRVRPFSRQNWRPNKR